MLKVEKKSRKLIKPETPTPDNLKCYNISFLDKLQLPVNEGLILFYGSKSTDIVLLEESLSKILVQFYPLAGRYIKNSLSVDCSDEGAEFIEAEALDVELMELVAKTETADQLSDLFPDRYFRVDEAPSDPILSIQATHFPCGGLTIAISVCHRVFDVSSLATFISAWSSTSININNNSYRSRTIPSFDLPSLLPIKMDQDGGGGGVTLKQSTAVNVLKRFVFKNQTLTIPTVNMINTNGKKKPASAVRVVSAVIAKALIGLDRAKHGGSREFIIFQPVNIRGRTIPPLPEHACGNLAIPALTPPRMAEVGGDIGIEELVGLMGDAVRKCISHHAQILSPNGVGRDIIVNTFKNLGEAFQNSERNLIIFSDWSKFGFYDADFGWGKPVWTATGKQRMRSNLTVLMRNKEGDGIEAWLHLNPHDMSCFEQDHDIKLFTDIS